MLTSFAPRGFLCLDAAGFVSTRAVRNAAVRDDIHAFSFYIGNRYGVGKEQFQIAFDNGKLVSPNREGDSHEAYSWASGPVREIDETRRILDSIGIDWRNVPTIDSAVDWNPLQAEWQRCMDWWKAYVDHALNVGFWGGYYGATAFGNALVQQDWWPEDFAIWTWGGSGEIPGSHMKQFAGYPSGNNYTSIGVTVDESVVRGGLWMASSFDSTPPPPPPTGDEVPHILQCTDAWAAFLSDSWPAFQVNWVGGPDRKNVYVSLGAEQHDITVEQLKQSVLIGRLPTGDMREWTAADFFDVVASGQGPKGDTGPKGDQGPKGDKGDPGADGGVAHGTYPVTFTQQGELTI